MRFLGDVGVLAVVAALVVRGVGQVDVAILGLPIVLPIRAGHLVHAVNLHAQVAGTAEPVLQVFLSLHLASTSDPVLLPARSW